MCSGILRQSLERRRTEMPALRLKVMNPLEFRRGVIKPIECYREAWELIKNHFWLLLAVIFVAGMIGGASMYILFGAMTCGAFYCYLKVIDRRDFKFEDLFKGFGFWLPGLIVTC